MGRCLFSDEPSGHRLVMVGRAVTIALTGFTLLWLPVVEHSSRGLYVVSLETMDTLSLNRVKEVSLLKSTPLGRYLEIGVEVVYRVYQMFNVNMSPAGMGN